MIRKILAVAAATLLFVQGATSVFAAVPTSPPPPPPPPGCHTCPGPPPPPTPVPTLAATVVAPVAVVDVHLSTSKVSRGHTARIDVNASTDDLVTVLVRYHKGKSYTYKSKVGSNGSTSKKWKVPKSAPVGKATVMVTVQGAVDRYSQTLVLVITK
jgi:hypothetical protein